MNVTVGGRRLSLSNLDKVLYPQTGYTKGEVIRHYARMAPVMLPHLRDRPIMLRRFPEGVDGPTFYEKRCPSHRPPWVQVSGEWETHSGVRIATCLVHEPATLVWLANLAALELHASLHRWYDRNRPTAMVLDLDPGPPAGLVDCARIALALRELLDRLGLAAFPKASGGKGLHLLVPLNGPVDYDETRIFARSLALMVRRRHSDLVATEIGAAKRRGLVLIDWGQNARQKSMVAPYSLRAGPRPRVSMPLRWDEIEAAVTSGDATGLVFGPEDAPERVSALGDLHAPVLERTQALPSTGVGVSR